MGLESKIVEDIPKDNEPAIDREKVKKWPYSVTRQRILRTTFLANFWVRISMKAAATAFMYDLVLLNVTRPDPIGYLNLSVSMPANKRYSFV